MSTKLKKEKKEKRPSGSEEHEQKDDDEEKGDDEEKDDGDDDDDDEEEKDDQPKPRVQKKRKQSTELKNCVCGNERDFRCESVGCGRHICGFHRQEQDCGGVCYRCHGQYCSLNGCEKEHVCDPSQKAEVL